MFKIKVGLKSFQTHSMQKCKHQIGRLVSCLKQPQISLYPNLEKKDVFLTNKQKDESIPFSIGKSGKSAITLANPSQKLAPHLNLPPMKKGAPTGGLKDGKGLLVLHMQNKCDAEHSAVFLTKSKTRQNARQNHKFVKSVFCNTKNNTTTLSTKRRRFISCAGVSNKKTNRAESPLRTIPLPTLVKKITTLRSPHIDKKSREQFEWKRQKAQMFFDLNSASQISFVLSVLTHSRFPGVEIEIGVESKTYFM
jgi:ribosomal protein S10